MHRPLGLPVGSVRALLLLALAARAVLDLREGRDLAPWLATAIIVSAAGYFASRTSGRAGPAPAPSAGDPAGSLAPAPRRSRPPLGLPAGTVRTLFLLAVGYGSWLWFRSHSVDGNNQGIVFVLGAFVLGVIVRWVLARLRRPEDQATLWFEHVQALVALICAGGLVAIGAGETVVSLPAWGEAALAAVAVYYVGAR